MLRVQHLDSKKRKGYIIANALLLALLLVIISQAMLQNIYSVSFQSRLFSQETQDKLDVKAGVYLEIANINNNPAWTRSSTSVTLNNGDIITLSTSDLYTGGKMITSQRNNIRVYVYLYRTDPTLNKWIIYKWAWVP